MMNGPIRRIRDAVVRKPQKRSRVRRFGPMTMAASAGAAIMYFFDTRDGRRRRAVARDRTASFAREVGRRTSRRGRYYAGKRHGISHGLRTADQGEVPNDATLQHKIESEVLRNYAKGHINVNVEERVAVLRGQLDRPEDIRALVDDVRKVPGVLEVRNLLHLPGTAAPSGSGQVRDGSGKKK